MSDLIIEESLLRKARVYRLIKGRQKIHDDYGLWISLGKKGSVCNAHHEPRPRCFEFYNISHMWKGRGWYWTKDAGKKEFSAGEGVMLSPGVIHDYNGCGSTYHEDFVCFSGPVAEQLARSGIITPGIKQIGPVRLLLPIIEMASDPGRDSQIKANIALQELLVKLYFENFEQEQEKQHIDSIDSLIRQIMKDPSRWWTVNEMAESVNLSLNQFIRVFSKHTGLTPKRYIDTLKIKIAAASLHDTDTQLAKVSEKLGYRDQFHFSRRFKEITGLSPAEYRKQGKSKALAI